jgi:AraC-like DNA-binding protein
MALFLALLPDAARSRLTRALELERAGGADHEIRFAGCWETMHALARQSAPQLAVFDPYASRGLDVKSCAVFSTEFPSTVLFAYGDFGRDALHDMLCLTEAGVRGVARYGIDDAPAMLRHLLTEALSYTVVGTVLAALRDILTPETVPLMRYLLNPVHPPTTPDAAAKFYHRGPKTLREHLKRAGLPPTEKLIVWARLFHAAHLLRGGARTAENAALLSGFSSRSAFCNQLQRYAGVTPKELVQRGDFGFLLTEFRRRYEQAEWELAKKGASEEENSPLPTEPGASRSPE